LSTRTAEHEARALAKARKDAQQRAEADAVWTQVRAGEKSVLDRTEKLKALRLAKQAEEDAETARQATVKTAKTASKTKRARVSTGA
jgi:hypothetical protein